MKNSAKADIFSERCFEDTSLKMKNTITSWLQKDFVVKQTLHISQTTPNFEIQMVVTG